MRRPDLRRLIRWAPLCIGAAAALVLWLAVDRWWPLLPLGYGPRWPWLGLPLVPLFAGGRWRERLLATALTATVVAFALLGVRLHLHSPTAGRATTVRLVSFNAATREPAIVRLLALARAADVDVIVVVECPQAAGQLTAPGYRQVSSGEVCAWSRLGDTPRLEHAPRDPKVIGWSGTIARLDLPGSGLDPIGVVHLRSVRNELEQFLDLSQLVGQADSMEARRSKRIAGSRQASAWFRRLDPRPGIVLGDFNLVVESARFRADWGAWHDVFEEIGNGTGHTWNSRWYGLRIDHVLHDDHWRPVSLEIGPDLGSDHRALLVTLAHRD